MSADLPETQRHGFDTDIVTTAHMLLLEVHLHIKG